MMDMSITDDELIFLLRIGTDHFGYKRLKEASEMDENGFQVFFNTLMQKGLLRPESSEKGKEEYRLNAIVVGWYESMMHYLAGKPQAVGKVLGKIGQRKANGMVEGMLVKLKELSEKEEINQNLL